VPRVIQSPADLREQLLPVLQAPGRASGSKSDSRSSEKSPGNSASGTSVMGTIAVFVVLALLKLGAGFFRNRPAPPPPPIQVPAPQFPQFDRDKAVEGIQQMLREQKFALIREMQQEANLSDEELDQLLKDQWKTAHPNEASLPWDAQFGDWRLAVDWDIDALQVEIDKRNIDDPPPAEAVPQLGAPPLPGLPPKFEPPPPPSFPPTPKPPPLPKLPGAPGGRSP
jgi:hypothetical protein